MNEHELRQRSHHGSAVLLAMESTKLDTLTEEQLLDVESWSRHFADRALALRRKLQTKQNYWPRAELEADQK